MIYKMLDRLASNSVEHVNPERTRIETEIHAIYYWFRMLSLDFVCRRQENMSYFDSKNDS